MNTEKNKKKTYSSPKLVVYGNIRQLTQTERGGSGFDGGVQPFHKARGAGPPS